MLKLKLVRNSATLDVTNSSLETVILNPGEILGTLSVRSIGYYRIKHGVLQQNLSKYFISESADVLCEHFNKFENTLKKEKDETNDKDPWLDKDDERRNISDKEILEKYIDLEQLCLSQSEKKEVTDMLYKYKDAFSVRDEIGTCPNIEVEIDITDISPLFIMLKEKIKLYLTMR